jgi:hypothetical protein
MYRYYDEYETLVEKDDQNGHNKTKEKFPTRHDYFLHKSGEQSSRSFIDSAAHIKENFIIGWVKREFFHGDRLFRERSLLTTGLSRCRWPDGTACSSANFTRVRTDYGVCYAANADAARVHHVQVGGTNREKNPRKNLIFWGEQAQVKPCG